MEGISNIRNQKLPEGINMLVSRKEWKFAFDRYTTELSEYADTIYYITYNALLNGKVKITVDNEIRFCEPYHELMIIDRNYPVSQYTNGMNLKKTYSQISLITSKGGSIFAVKIGNETCKVEFILNGVAVVPIR